MPPPGPEARDARAPPLSILLVDDEAPIRVLLAEALRAKAHQVAIAADGAQAMALLSASTYDLLITDVKLPKVDGMTLLHSLRERSPGTDAVVMTAYANIVDAVAAMRDKAADYIAKPFEISHLLRLVESIAQRRQEQRDGDAGADAFSDVDEIVGQSPGIARLRSEIGVIALSEAPVLISGESGTGKDLVARAIHRRSHRRGGPFIAVNCAAFPEPLLEAELFGHVRGAFTGAVRDRIGRFQAADQGTLFLDEIGEMPTASQAKLLRALQDGSVEPLGSNTTVRVDVRVISATNADLAEQIGRGRFRADLYYRIKVFDLAIPPLRERRGDVPMLIQHFLRRQQYLRKPGEGAASRPKVTPRAWAALVQHDFPGNVRELEHALEHARVMAAGAEIDLEHLPVEIRGSMMPRPERPSGFLPLSVATREFEREYLLRALSSVGGNKSRAAQLLNISRTNLWEKMRSLGLSSGEPDDS